MDGCQNQLVERGKRIQILQNHTPSDGKRSLPHRFTAHPSAPILPGKKAIGYPGTRHLAGDEGGRMSDMTDEIDLSIYKKHMGGRTEYIIVAWVELFVYSMCS